MDNIRIRCYKNAAVRGHIDAQKALSKICADKSETEYSASSAYMWAYLAYLCEGKVGHKPEPADNVSSTEIKEAEAEAQRMYDEI